ncbi:glycosyltransferase family 39 protein [Pelobacter propionicus]|uniref:Glycosyltransferase RgtA/B/C/D-like domain-containing protein n=1 Tax=Pelobacter propionicus (strain DSM 2379 / NBRC 103807 / OttBd1) TaxID=338966 RepID=A1ASH8_PELPD|nr:glycosyltransferase family 39 protein [Pelobacter propionicus]ABL00299.1 conserved hypothetical protein [Pelobacter propionicus DSM 2379]
MLLGAENKNKVNTKVILLISLAVFAAYLKATRTGALVLDDMTLINSIRGTEPSFSLFFSGDGPTYFRPLAYLSFFLDMRLFRGDPVAMHFANILIHVCNSVLVYCVALRLTHDDAVRQRSAMVAAFMFGLHPVNSEAVIWISSRYDLLCCFFMLASLLLLVRQAASDTVSFLVPLSLMFLCSMLSKESSLLFPAAAVVFIFNERKILTQIRALAIMASLMLSLLFYLFLRNGLHIAVDKGIGDSLAASAHVGIGAMLAHCMAATGFYVKKMLYPFPLSFVISSINSSSCLILFALFFVVLTALFFIRRDLRFPIALMVTALVPPLYAMIGRLAWTPYAERYVYIPMVGFALLVSIASSRYLQRIPTIFLFAGISLLAIPTTFRVNTWTEPVTFWKDTISKSPHFGTPHVLLAAELISTGRLDEAEQHILRARELGITKSKELNYASAVHTALLDARKRKQ